jgi:hypothetical protein
VNEQVEVRFGGSTTGLDNASNKAQQDIKGVGKTAEGLKGTFASIGQSFKNMFSGTNFGDVSTKMRTIRSEMKELVEGASHGNIQMGILGRTWPRRQSMPPRWPPPSLAWPWRSAHCTPSSGP